MRLFSLVLLLAGFLATPSSAQNSTPKTIYQLLKLKPGGCKVTKESVEMVMEEGIMAPDGWDDPKKTSDVRSVQQVMEEARPLFQLSSRFADRYNYTPSYTVTLSNGNELFRENNLYGLRKPNGEVILEPVFEQVFPYDKKGFTGYKGFGCNYYDMDGRKVFDTDYYAIHPTVVNTFIVQTKGGYGVVNTSKKTIIKPSFYKIDVLAEKGQFFYKVFTSSEDAYYLSQNTKDTLWISMPHDNPKIISTTYWQMYGSLINVKTKKKLICEPENYVDIVSEKDQLASLSTKDRKRYLFNFNDGKLITTTAFDEIVPFRDNGFAAAAVPAPDSGEGYFRTSQWGVIDRKGQWVLKPAYRQLRFITNTLLEVSNEMGLEAVIALDGKMVTPYKYKFIRNVGDTLLVAWVAGKEVKSDLIHVRDQKIIRESFPYVSFSEAEICEDKLYIAETAGGEALVNEKFEPILPRTYQRIFYGPEKNYILASDFPRGGRSVRQLYDCGGALKTFNLEGKTIDTFDALTPLDKDLVHLLLTDGTGYFLLPDGTAVRNDGHWQDVKKARCRDLFVTMSYGGKFGIVNSEGKTIIPQVFEYISPFNDETGLASYVYKDSEERRGYLTCEGELLFDGQYKNVEWLRSGLFKVQQGSRWGVVNRENKVIVPLSYDRISLVGGLIYVGSDASTWYTMSGEVVK